MSTGWIEELVEALMSKAGNVALTSAAPEPIATTAAVGVATTAARADHVHAHGNQAGGSLHALASASAAGFMSASEFTKLAGVATAAAALGTATPASIGTTGVVGSSALASPIDHVHAHGSLAGGNLHALATADAAGFMSSDDFTKLTGVAAGAAAVASATPEAVTAATGASGTAATAARSDHRHQVSVGSPVAVGSANAAGSATSLSRSDHVHSHGNQAGGALHAVANSGAAGFAPAVGGTADVAMVSTDGSTPSWGKVTAAMLATSAAIAATQLATGGANQVLWSNGTTNSWTGAPVVTSVTASDYLKAGTSAAATGTVRLPEASTIVAGTTAAVTTSATANTFNGPTSAVLAVAGTARQTVTAATSTWNFGSADVVVGDGYINVAGSAAVGGVIRLRDQISPGDSRYITTRRTDDTLDRYILSMYGEILVLGNATQATVKQGYEKVALQADTALEFYIGNWPSPPKMTVTSDGVGIGTLTTAYVQSGVGSLTVDAADDLALQASDAILEQATRTIICQVNGATKLDHTTTQTTVRQRMVTTDELVVGGTYIAIGTDPAGLGTIRLPFGVASIRCPNFDKSAAVNVVITDTTSGNHYFGPNATMGGTENHVYVRASGGSLRMQQGGTTRIEIDGTGVGFFGATPAAKPTVSGSRGGNAALADLLTELATLGMITNSTTA